MGRHVDGNSNHCDAHKNAFIQSSIHRMFEFGLEPPEVAKELDYLRRSCAKNRLSPGRVDCVYNRVCHQYEMNNISSLEPLRKSPKEMFLPGWVTLSYSKTHQQLANLLKKLGVKTAFRVSNTTRRMIPKLKGSVSELSSSGVYKMNCGDCKETYIGQTRRAFCTRRQEHLRYPQKSAFCGHLLESDHSPLNADFEVISHTHDNRRMNVLESLEILQLISCTQDPVLNTVLGPCKGSLLHWLYPPPSQLVKGSEICIPCKANLSIREVDEGE